MRIAILSKGGANYTTRRLKEVAKARGHDVEVINYAKCYVSIEKNQPVIRYKGRSLDHFDVISFKQCPIICRNLFVGG